MKHLDSRPAIVRFQQGWPSRGCVKGLPLRDVLDSDSRFRESRRSAVGRRLGIREDGIPPYVTQNKVRHLLVARIVSCMDECARVERPSGACSGLYEILCTLEPICKRESHIDPIRRDPCIAIRVLCGGGVLCWWKLLVREMH